MFCALFPNRLDTKVRSTEGVSWRMASRFHSLTDEEISSSIERTSKLYRAVPADDFTRFTVITLQNKTGAAPNLEAISRLIKALEAIGVLRSSIYKESGSENWQVFVFWNRPISVTELSAAFENWLANLSVDITDCLSIFPGNEHLTLPLQPGFAWLNENGTIVATRGELTLDLALERFLSDMEEKSNDWSSVQCLLVTQEPQRTISDLTHNVQTFSDDNRNGELIFQNCADEYGEPKESPEQPFADKPETNREVFVPPEEVAACENMQQLSLFPITAVERGPPLSAEV